MTSKSTKSKTKRSPSKSKPTDNAADSPSELVEDGVTTEIEVPPEPMENVELDPPVPAPKPEPAPESPPESSLPRIHLRVFEKVSGMKWDQFAGFRAYAKSNNLGPMTIPAWREAVQAYKNKPMS